MRLLLILKYWLFFYGIEMEQSKYDLAKAFSQIKTTSGAASSFLDVLGADVDSSFTQPLQHAITASTAEISLGG